MKVTFVLKDPKSKGKTPVMQIVRIGQDAFKLSTKLPIDPKHWDKGTNRAKSSKYFKDHYNFNMALNEIESVTDAAFRGFYLDNKRYPSISELKTVLVAQKQEKEHGKMNIFRFMDEYVKGSVNRRNAKTDEMISPKTIEILRRGAETLKEFQEYSSRRVDFDTMTMDFYQEYCTFLEKAKKLARNTLGKRIKTLKTFLHAAEAEGIKVNPGFKNPRFKAPSENTSAIYLNEDELRELRQLDLLHVPRLDRVRDLFLLGCYTGFRYSDFCNIKPECIRDGKITIRMQKTGDIVVAKIVKPIEEMMKKYKGKTANSLPESYENQTMNAYLKELGQMISSMHDQSEKNITKGGLKISTNKAKWEMLTTHTARRSFITNLLKRGASPIEIMASSGHKSEKELFKYVRMTSHEKVEAAWEHLEEMAS